MRKSLKVLGIFIALALPAAAQAQCLGVDLIAELTAADREALQAKADSHPYARGNLWEARRGAEVIHLVGTYHLPDPRHDQLLSRTRPILAEAKVLLVEASPDEEERLKAEIARRPEFMVIGEGPDLSEQLTPEEWEHLSAEARERGIPPFMAAKFRPWYMAVLLGLPPCATEGLKQGDRGLDHLLVAEMTARGGEVRALEPFDTLFSIFGDLSPEDELDMVRASLLIAARPEDMTVTLANAYFAGQSRLIWELSQHEALSAADLRSEQVEAQFKLMNEVLMAERNRRWIRVLTKAAQDGPVLAAFGALHLSGEDGVLRLLEREGFSLQAQ